MQCDGWEGPCERQDAERYRMNTQYYNDEQNYAILCPECQKACDDYWADMWAEYYETID